MLDNTAIKTSLIAAMGKNRVIGNNNALIWDIPIDMAWFREKTRGKTVIMGRNTYESILGIRSAPLPKRTNIVVTRQQNYDTSDFPSVLVSQNLEDAIALAKEQAKKEETNEVFIIGGAQIYALGIPLSDRLYLTYIEQEYEGDTFFPQFDENNWDVSYQERHEKTEKTPALTFNIYDRKLTA